MKCLKIEHGKGYYYSLEESSWNELDKISKEDILSIVNTCLEDVFEMDNPSSIPIHNKAHEIIYNNLYSKFIELNQQRNRFKDESEQLFKEALVKYG